MDGLPQLPKPAPAPAYEQTWTIIVEVLVWLEVGMQIDPH